MTNEDIVKSLHKMADRIGAMLEDPILAGTVPLVSITVDPKDDGFPMRLICGVEFPEEETFNGG